MRYLDLHNFWPTLDFLLFFKEIGRLLCNSKCLWDIWTYTISNQLFILCCFLKKLEDYCVSPNPYETSGFTQYLTNFFWRERKTKSSADVSWFQVGRILCISSSSNFTRVKEDGDWRIYIQQLLLNCPGQ